VHPSHLCSLASDGLAGSCRLLIKTAWIPRYMDLTQQFFSFSFIIGSMFDDITVQSQEICVRK
jgi:hypothetical protein